VPEFPPDDAEPCGVESDTHEASAETEITRTKITLRIFFNINNPPKKFIFRYIITQMYSIVNICIQCFPFYSVNYSIKGGIVLKNMYLDPKIVGEVIAHFRKKKNISQEVLSGLSDIGRTHLSAIERGERKPTLETLYRISCALEMNMSEIAKEIENRIGK
jgi:DNA-binding XRE family transcriptional regulator